MAKIKVLFLKTEKNYALLLYKLIISFSKFIIGELWQWKVR